MENTLHLSDELLQHDSQKTFRTQIIGKNELGEVLFETENNTVIGGALYTLEKLFNVKAGLNVQYLNDIMGIANTGPAPTGGTPYKMENAICLFGVGIGGAGDAINSVVPVKIKEREIVEMIPFRQTATALSTTDAQKYWFRKLDAQGRTMYYLKNFESAPVIRSLWKDGAVGEDGTEVTDSVHTSARTEPIETFVELVLKINKNDCREFFEISGQSDKARVNTIGLFTGIKGTLGDGKTDYKEVKLFSKLNINNEMLEYAKELTIVYRIFTS